MAWRHNDAVRLSATFFSTSFPTALSSEIFMPSKFLRGSSSGWMQRMQVCSGFPEVVALNVLTISKLPSSFSRCSEASVVCTLSSIMIKSGRSSNSQAISKRPSPSLRLKQFMSFLSAFIPSVSKKIASASRSVDFPKSLRPTIPVMLSSIMISVEFL